MDGGTVQTVAVIAATMVAILGMLWGVMALVTKTVVQQVDKWQQGAQKQLDDFRADIDKRFDVVDRRFDEVDKRFDVVDRRFDEVDKRFDVVDRRFDGVNKRFDVVDRRFDGVKADIDKRFDGVKADFDKRFDVVDRRFDGVNKRFDGVKADIDKRFDDVSSRLDKQSDQITDVRNQVATLSERMARVEERVGIPAEPVVTA